MDLPPQTSLSSEPTYAEAQKLLEKKKWSEAVLSFRSYLKKDPKSIAGIIGLSVALTYSGKREEALNLLVHTAEHLKGEQKNALVRRIRVLSKLFLTDETFKIYQEGLNFLLAKKYKNAKEKFEKALSEESDNVEVLTRMGQGLMLDSDPENAVEHLRTAERINPFEPEVHLWLGRTLQQHGAIKESIPELRMAVDELAGSELAPVWLAESLVSSGQPNSAIRILSNDAKEWPFHVLTLITCARLRVQMAHVDIQTLWAARKDLQLAMSRLDEYMLPSSFKYEESLSLDLRKPQAETKTEIQKLMQQIQSRLDEFSSQR